MATLRARNSAAVLVPQDSGRMEPVPAYAETDPNSTDPASLAARAATLRDAFPQIDNHNDTPLLSLPLTHHPGPWHPFRRQFLDVTNLVSSSAAPASTSTDRNPTLSDLNVDDDLLQEVYDLHTAVITSFFSSITSRREDVVASFISAGLISPDCPSSTGETPLLAAVRAGDPRMVRTLVTLGADVNGYGSDSPSSLSGEFPSAFFPDPYDFASARLRLQRPPPQRTPMQLAASRGNLALVKFLLEDCGADDSLVAPDGEIALRLAADGGHREVVAYLPARRAGAWRRWRVAHEREMRLVRKAWGAVWRVCVVLGWEVPRFLVWTVPKGVWEARGKIAKWCVKQVKETPRRLIKGVKGMGKAARWVGRKVKKVPDLAKRAAAAMWRAAKRTPAALAVVGAWVWKGIKGLAAAAARVGGRVLALLHTVFSAVVDFFRTITLKDVWDGVVEVLWTVFVGLPKAVWRFLAKFGTMSYEVLGTLLGCAGKCLWYLGYGIWWLARWFPKKLWEILSAMSRSVGKGFREVLVWVDPKRV